MVGAIIIGECGFKEYTHTRFSYEWACCWLGWSLVQLNPALLKQRGLLQRATDHVANFVFKGCSSRINLKQPQPHKRQKCMLPLPVWLRGLSGNQDLKDGLKELYAESVKVYDRHLDGRDPTDAEVLEASREAVKFYLNKLTLTRLKRHKKIANVETFADHFKR